MGYLRGDEGGWRKRAAIGEKHVPGAKAHVDAVPIMPGRLKAKALGYQSRPIYKAEFSGAS
jgi:hypothetical protein